MSFFSDPWFVLPASFVAIAGLFYVFRGRAAMIGNMLANFFSSPFFFILLGCLFLSAAYWLLSRLGNCGERLVGMSCLELSQVNLAFGLLGTLLGISLLIYGTSLHAADRGQIANLKVVYDEIKVFFASPMFFIFLGSFFIYCSLILLDATHTAFVFILAVLGIAMILFGTGSQALASGEFPTQTSGKTSVSIAGGAAALAAIFGAGIVYFAPGIQGFFKRTVDYGFLELSSSGSATNTIDLETHVISASTVEGRPLHLLKQTGRVQIMVPRYSRQGSATISVSVKGERVPDSAPPSSYTITWEKVKPALTSANEELYIDKQSLDISVVPAVTHPVDEKGRPQPPVTLPAPK